MAPPKRYLLLLTSLAAAAAAFAAQMTPAERLARWKEIDMPYHPAPLSRDEREMVSKLVHASLLLDDIFWRQSDSEGLELYKTIKIPALKSLLHIMGCRWDLLDNNRPFFGSAPMPPGHDLYPQDLTLPEINRYLAQYPGDKPLIYDPYTVLVRQNGRLIGIPYHVEYRQFLEPMAKDLRDAAAFSPDPAFAAFLRLRADALLTDDYYKSDLAWLELKDPKFDIIFAPYETYLDDLLGVKTSYGAAVLIRNEEESRKLAVYQQYVPEIQEALPLSAEDKPSKRGHLTPLEVMDAPFRTGDLLHGYQAVADNLPNDPRIHQEKGSKKIFFKNFMDARVNQIVLPVARRVMNPAQAAQASAEGYFMATLMHEISHELGPNFARTGGKQVEINAAIGPAYSGLEEAKADVTGMFAMKWMVDRGTLPKERLPEFYASYVAGLFRTLRFGAGEAHGRAETMEFNYLLEQKAVTFAAGRYTVDYARIPAVLAQLTKELLEIEATGDRQRAESWFARYDKIPPELQKALAAAVDIPVDVFPIFSFPYDVE